MTATRDALAGVATLVALAVVAASLGTVPAGAPPGVAGDDTESPGSAGGGASTPTDAWGGVDSVLVPSVDLGATGEPRGAGDPAALLVGAGLLLGGLVVLLSRLSGARDRSHPSDPDADDPALVTDDPRPSLDVPADNAVYRAWLRLVDSAGADPDRTPAEVAATADERGLPTDAVRTVTRAFRAVRYGGHRPAETRLESVRAAADRIEARRSTGRRSTEDGESDGRDSGR